MKKTSTLILRNSLLLLATLFTISSLTATAQTKPAAARITQAIDEANLVPMHTKVHPMTRAAFDQGLVADSQPMNRMLLNLKRSQEQETALRNLMDEQQTKNSPNYHAWLTPAQFGQQFGVAPADVQTVTDWLAKNGFTGIKVSPGNMFIEFSGTAGLVRTAFHTEMHNFLLNGEKHMANVSVPQMPAALSPVVAGIHSLHDFRKKSFLRYSKAIQQARARSATGPQFTYSNVCPPGPPSGTQPCAAVGPGDFAKIYNLPPTTGAGALDGTGQTIAIVARSNINLQDITDFRTAFGLSANFTSSNIVLSGADPGIMIGDDGEATLDVEWSGAVAPNAKILLVVSDSQQTGAFLTDGVDYSALYIVENNLAPIMSESFGSAEIFSDNLFDSGLWEQAAAQGITVMVSTGDNGSDVADAENGSLNAVDFGLTVSGTASTQFNVAVGGTDFDDANNSATFWTAANSGTSLASAKSYIPEIPWNSSCAATATMGSTAVCTSVDPDGLSITGGSGGQSNCSDQDSAGDCLGGYQKPTWQAGTGVPADGVRDIPDVSLFAAINTASNNFYVLCLADSDAQGGLGCSLTGQTINFTPVGGTSVASPSFAGIMALVNQSQVNAGKLKAGEGQGNANYVLYPLAQKAGLSCNSSTPATITNTICTFYDVTKGNNSVECVAGSPNCSNQTASGLGVLVEPPTPAPFNATTPGWTTTTGYDLATGLGSVNVTNLAANWGSITTNFIGTTTTFTAPAAGSVNITHGATVNFALTVTPASGTAKPTGDVSLVAQPVGAPQFSVTGGTLGTAPSPAGQVAIPTNQLPGGTYPVVAHYAGDGTFAASDSAGFTVTVSPEPSTTQTTMLLQEPVSPFSLFTTTNVPYGSIYLFRMDVLGTLNNDNQVCETVSIPCPTGTITLTDTGGTPINDFLSTATGGSTNVASLNSLGYLEDRLLGTTGITGGAHTYTATYSGDSSYNTSKLALPITIVAASTGTSVTANGSSTATAVVGQPVTLVATVSGFYNLTINGTNLGNFVSNGAGPTGSVTFSTCGTPPCTSTVVPVSFNNSSTGTAFGTATLTTSFATAGVKTISATFTTGDTNYTGSVSSGTSNATLTVNATQTGSFTVGYSPQPFVLNSATGAASTLTVTVTPTGGFTGIVAVTPTAASLPPGVSCTPSPLNINVTAAAAVTGQLMCSVTATSTTLTASNAREDRMLEAKAVPPTTGTKGWWTLSAGTGFAAMFLLFLPGGRKKFRAALGLGLVCILALTAGCNGAGGGVKPPPPTNTVTKLTVTSAKVVSPNTFAFSVSVTGGTPTGMVQLFDGATMIGTAASVVAGSATPTAPALAVGTHAISAHYLGDATTLASASGTLNLTVTGSTTIAITTSPAATPVAPAINVTVQ
jgi:hypothetical protein